MEIASSLATWSSLMTHHAFNLIALLSFIFVQPGLGQAKIAKDMSDVPDDERQLMQLADGFEMQIVASEPTIVNPLQINFDAQGRLWVLCAPRYPQLLPGQEPNDYVVILEDFDEKGLARKSRKFVEGLMVPTGMIPGDGGVYVGQGEALLHFRDTKGTGKADERRVLLSGFGTADTHHTLNTFRWGPDGSLYFNQGLYTLSTVETPFGPRRHFGGGIWQLRTDRLRLEVFDRSILPNNTWGHAFDAWGQSFVASAWPGALNMILPDSPLQKQPRNELVPPLSMTQIGGERHCGLEIISGRHLPDDWQGNLLTGDFMSHRVYRYQLNDDGRRFLAKGLPPLVQSKHRKFRPIDIKQGPDGAIYIADLYQQIIQHNQVDFRDPRRDHQHGRVWRVVRKDRPLLPTPKLVGVSLTEVVEQLKAPEYWTRLFAKRVLAEGDATKAAAALGEWTQKLDAKDVLLQRHLLEALWAYQSIDRVEPKLLARLLKAEDFHVRAAAIRVLAAWQDRLPDAVRWLGQQAGDVQPRVRLEAVLAASHVPKAEALPAVLKALDQPVDPMLDFALRKTAIILQPYWYPEFQSGKLTFDGNAKYLTFALQAIRAPDAVPVLVDLLAKGKVPSENQVEIMLIVARLGTGVQQMIVWNRAVDAKGLTPVQHVRLLEGLTALVRENKNRPAPAHMGLLKANFADPHGDLAAAAIRLAGAFRLESLREDIVGLLAKETTDPAQRQAAAQALVDLGGQASVKTFESLAASDRPYAIRLQAIEGLTSFDVTRAAVLAGSLLRQVPPVGVDPAPLFSAFLRTTGGAMALARVLMEEKPAADAAKIGLRVVVGLGSPAPELTAVLHASAGQPGQTRKWGADEVKRLLALVPMANPSRGELIFRRSSLGCFQCHALGGAGGRVGPDLSGIGTSAQLDYLLESIVLPSKIVREGYTTAHVYTKDGKVLSGILQRETPKELVLRDPVRDDVVIQQSDIDEKKVGGSLMPNGLDQSLTDAELADLTRFLSELGKPGPFGVVTHLRVARRWQMLTWAPETLALLDDGPFGKALQEDGRLTWSPIYSKVSGLLPVAELPRSIGKERASVRTQLEVVTPGKITVTPSDLEGLKIWLDGKSVPVQQQMTLDLDRGVHTIAIGVDLAARKAPFLRCELVETLGSAAQARFVDGK